jgi:hypothetical protein
VAGSSGASTSSTSSARLVAVWSGFIVLSM